MSLTDKDEYTFDDIWPKSVNGITRDEITKLSRDEFARLTSALKQRMILLGHTNASASSKVRNLKRIRRKNDKASMDSLTQAMSFYEFRESDLLDNFQPNRKKKWVKTAKRKLSKIIDADNFSLVDNPKETINLLAELVRYEGILKSAQLNFKDKRVLDVAPYLLLGLLSDCMAPFIVGGKITWGQQKVMDAVGLRDFLGIKPFKIVRPNVDVWPFPLKKRHKTTSTSASAGNSTSFQKLSDNLVDTVNDWLKALPEPRTLSGRAMAQISNVATETLNNAERHSLEGGGGEWVMAGFMARRPVDKSDPLNNCYNHDHWYDCHLAFVNRGRTIGQAVLTTPNKDILDEITSYQNLHSKDVKTGKFSDETLATVFAIQDNVSSKPDNAGGKGMMTIVEVTNQLALQCVKQKLPKITIVSGMSCINLTDDYRSFKRANNGPNGRRQFFNNLQNMSISPSNDHVFDLDVGFPGTVIAVRFTLDPDTMEAPNDNPRP